VVWAENGAGHSNLMNHEGHEGTRSHRTPYIWLLLLTGAALLVHGYHPFAEDAEIYLPGVERILNPALFPVGQEFFASHAHLTLFPNLIAFSLRVTHLPMTVGLFLWHVASILLLLLACWQLSGLLFSSSRARWGGVCLVAAMLTIPVAGTALYIMDQYSNPRNLAAFAAIFAVTRVLEKKYWGAFLWLAFAGSVHPLMAAFAFSFCLLLVVMQSWGKRAAGVGWYASALMLLPFGVSLDPPTSPAYHAAAMRHQFHYIQLWAWYEQLGAAAPIFLFWWFGRIARSRQWHRLALICRALLIYNVIYFVAALTVDLPPRFESLARLQPLRSLHLLYMLLFLIMGGMLGELVLKNRVWLWLVLFVPLGAGMYAAQRELFPESAHIEWPWSAPRNPWAQAFLWIRNNTPVDAVFAIDPDFMQLRGEDEVGFRCLAERSRLADLSKDSGAVSMFPPLADKWWEQVKAQNPWKNLQLADFKRLKKTYGANWVLVQQSDVPGLDCKYENRAVQVCRVP
jgi:hypothetical protein